MWNGLLTTISATLLIPTALVPAGSPTSRDSPTPRLERSVFESPLPATDAAWVKERLEKVENSDIVLNHFVMSYPPLTETDRTRRSYFTLMVATALRQAVALWYSDSLRPYTREKKRRMLQAVDALRDLTLYFAFDLERRADTDVPSELGMLKSLRAFRQATIPEDK